ncbi:MAG: cytochrome c [Pseudomonadota bacterium]
MRRLSSALILVAGGALAHSGATGVVKQRMDGMEEMGYAAKALGAIKLGAIPFSAETLKRAGSEIARHAEAAKELFPEGSGGAPSDAKPLIWEDRAGFDRLMEDLRLASERLAFEADETPETLALIDEIGGYCKDCHGLYRAKQ